jgi:hypothetical protein
MFPSWSSRFLEPKKLNMQLGFMDTKEGFFTVLLKYIIIQKLMMINALNIFVI